jgi:hypothetical protein
MRLTLRRALEAAGVEFIEDNGGGPGVRLRQRRRSKKSNIRSKLLLSMLGPVLINTHQSCWTDGLSSLRPFPNCLQSDACGSPWIGKSQFFRSN